MIVYAIYSAFLISYITLSETNLPFNDLAGFVDDGSYELIVVNNSAAHEFFAYYEKEGVIQGMKDMLKKKLPQSDMEAFHQVSMMQIILIITNTN